MPDETMFAELQEFFKALAEPKRLRIVGLLAQQSYTGEQLAALLGLSESTVSHHLSYLVHVGLVSAEAQGYYSVYTLRLNKIHKIAAQLLAGDELPKLAAEVDMDAYDRKVLENFTTVDGRIRFPAQQKKLDVILRHALKEFEPGRRYTEKQVNEILARYNDDTAFFRRSLIERNYLARETDGSQYWRVDASSSTVVRV
jgi:biotin operon repressor